MNHSKKSIRVWIVLLLSSLILYLSYFILPPSSAHVSFVGATSPTHTLTTGLVGYSTFDGKDTVVI